MPHSHTSEQQGYRGRRTLGVPERFVWSVWNEGLDLLKREGHVDEQGRVYFARKWQAVKLKPRSIQRADGQRLQLETWFHSASGSTASGEFGYSPNKALTVRIDIHFPLRTPIEGSIAKHLRNILAHELAHAIDLEASRVKGLTEEEALEEEDLARFNPKELKRRYHNDPTEVNAWRHEVHRYLSTAAVGQKVRELAERGTPRHKIVQLQLAEYDRWREIAPYLTTPNKRKILETAAYVVQAHLDDEDFQTVRLAYRIARRWVREQRR